MSGNGRFNERLTEWFIFSIGLIVTAFIGYFDYLTGNYSLLVFYIFPIALVSWFSGLLRGGVIAILSGCARLIADYAAFTDKRLLYWNSIEDAVFLLLVAYLIVLLRKNLKFHHDV